MNTPLASPPSKARPARKALKPSASPASPRQSAATPPPAHPRTHGGKRAGAGRKPAGVPTVARRVPLAILREIDWLAAKARGKIPPGAVFLADPPSSLNIPAFLEPVPAGFPSPAEGYLGSSVDFNKVLVSNPAATYALRIKGTSMNARDIESGDWAVVDFSREPQNGDVVIACIDGEYTIKTLVKKNGKVIGFRAESNDPNYTDKIIKAKTEDDKPVGVVLWTIRSHQKPSR